MKRSEILVKYRDEIEKSMVKCYRNVLEGGSRTQYTIYIWDNGKIVEYEDVEGGNSELVPSDWVTQEFFCVDKISMPFYDPFDGVWYEDIPEDEDEKEKMAKELLDAEVEAYEENLSDYYDEMIREAKYDERHCSEYV